MVYQLQTTSGDIAKENVTRRIDTHLDFMTTSALQAATVKMTLTLKLITQVFTELWTYNAIDNKVLTQEFHLIFFNMAFC